MQTFRIPVNAVQIEHHGTKDDRLVAILHDQSLTATKLGCGTGHCGACTVWLEGRPVRACELTVESTWVSAQSSYGTVHTLEGLAELMPQLADCLINAFLDEQAAQCGYCSAGILMKAAALIRDHDLTCHGSGARPLSEAEIAKALDEHLCRCGSHRRVLRAVELACQRYSSRAAQSSSKITPPALIE
jgi:nicotinate dehydrogenase subunit A